MHSRGEKGFPPSPASARKKPGEGKGYAVCAPVVEAAERHVTRNVEMRFRPTALSARSATDGSTTVIPRY